MSLSTSDALFMIRMIRLLAERVRPVMRPATRHRISQVEGRLFAALRTDTERVTRSEPALGYGYGYGDPNYAEAAEAFAAFTGKPAPAERVTRSEPALGFGYSGREGVKSGWIVEALGLDKRKPREPDEAAVPFVRLAVYPYSHRKLHQLKIAEQDLQREYAERCLG